MPNVDEELHLWRRERVIFWELEFRGEDAVFEGCALGTLDQRFPDEHVVFADGAGGDAFGRVRGQPFVFFEEAFGSGGGHCGGFVGGIRGVRSCIECVGSYVSVVEAARG